MSFSSLLAEITKDKKLEDKLKKEGNKFKGGYTLEKGKVKSRPQRTSGLHNPTQRKYNNSKRKSVIKSESIHRDYHLDPAVERLKAARRKEKERLQAIKAAKHGRKITRTVRRSESRASVPRRVRNQTSTRSRTASTVRPRKRPIARQAHVAETIKPIKVTAAAPKMTFKELMKKADELKTKPQVTFKREIERGVHKDARKDMHKDDRRDVKRSAGRYIGVNGEAIRRRVSAVGKSRETQPHLGNSFSGRPSKELLEKLAKRKVKQKAMERTRNRARIPHPLGRREEEKHTDEYGIDAIDSDDDDDMYDEDASLGRRSDDDLDDFIVDDENDDRTAKELRHRAAVKRDGYDRDEIWSIFNRGKKRRRAYGYDDYDDDGDDDNMEATGAEVLDEEERTLRQAKLDDKREAALLEKHKLEKLRRKRDR
mgnify:CR=1 FL=1